MTDTPTKPRWFQFSLRTLLIVMFCIATFFGGYRVGFYAGVKSRNNTPTYDEFTKLILSTLETRSDWLDENESSYDQRLPPRSLHFEPSPPVPENDSPQESP